ncbi:MAG: hypothetical protein U9Q73_02630 [Nanoarchaeota archaeon]|nr:hypothetical protein [Nanoarchaeota archaeon]
MTLITKLEDSEEGLIGITERNERVHLGKPRIYKRVVDFEYKSYEKAIGAFSENYIQKLNKKQRKNKIKNDEQEFREDDTAYWYSNPDDFEQYTSNRAFSVGYLRFEKNKEDTFRVKPMDKYFVEDEDRYLKIHRKGDK